MKGFFIFLIFIGLSVGGYLYRDQITSFISKQTASGTSADEAPLPPGTTKVHMDGKPAWEKDGDENPVADSGQPSGSTPGTAPPEMPAEPEKTSAEETPKTGDVGNNDEFAEMFPLPEFRPLEEIVGGWKELPASVFPREITAKTNVEMVLGSAGKSVIPPGTKITALSIEGSTLTVASNRTSPVRGSVDIDDTDLKEVLTRVYENFKKRKINYALAQRDQARRKKMAGVLAARAADAAKSNLLGPKPEVSGNGQVPAMIASINNKDVTEFHVGMIKGWGAVLYDEIDGEPYWTGTVSYDAKTIFGTFPAEAMALMRRGKVEKWIYSGSHEPVP